MNIKNIEVIYRPPAPVGADPMNLTPTISIKMTTGSGEAYGLCLDAADEDGTPFDTERMIFAINLLLSGVVDILKNVEEGADNELGEPISCGHEKGGEWISVDERLPEEDLPKDTDRRTIRCLVATNKGSVKACVRQRYIIPSTGKLTPWCWSRDMFATPTHWMPLPEPPKGD